MQSLSLADSLLFSATTPMRSLSLGSGPRSSGIWSTSLPLEDRWALMLESLGSLHRHCFGLSDWEKLNPVANQNSPSKQPFPILGILFYETAKGRMSSLE